MRRKFNACPRIVCGWRPKMRPAWSPPPWKNIRMTTAAPEIDLSDFLTHQRRRIHLIGVAGSGMTGLAALLLELGHQVSGSDKVSTQETDRLQRLGLRFCGPHRAEQADGVELVIY